MEEFWTENQERLVTAIGIGYSNAFMPFGTKDH